MQTKSSNFSTMKPLKGHFIAKRMSDKTIPETAKK